MRELTEYPTGSRRRRILVMAVLASLIASYEAQIAPVLPLLLEDLGISLVTYGTVSAVALCAGAVASMIGGRLTDRFGRVRVLVPLMMLTALCCFAMAAVRTTGQFLLVRAVLSALDGVVVAATAPLVRDFSPRMGRAQAFGFWTWGPVGANFMAAAIAGLTLPLFDNAWQSQFLIMGATSLLISLVIAFNIADLSPQLRARVQQTEHRALGEAAAAEPVGMRTLFAHKEMWAHVVGISVWLVLYLTLSLFGQKMLVDSFALSPSQASAVMAVFWVLNIGTVVLAGRWSDRLQLRKPFTAGGTAIAAMMTGYLVVLVGRGSISLAELLITGALIGAGMGAAYAPWMANYSENTEDVDPRLQGGAWGVFSFLTRAVAVLVVLLMPQVVAVAGWGTWLVVSLGCLLAFLPMLLLFRGPWRRSPTRDTASSPTR
ncbi:MFS transporter [Saccharopolyspora sp. ID03-671]|uniref:MFS transporter n=1 Tax=Saccharopolyspora sp. ID03-671 TaxID=3073066 RepID=UPI00324EC02A